ncbi:MAG: hypothetical protein MUC43_14950, partial [Pirellula sp.]|nr:hypothetical protein [Pirellula sp.]
RFDAMIMVATAVSAVFISIEFCILIGVVLSFALYVPRAAQIHVSELTLTNTRIIREATKNDALCSYVRILNIEGEMFFGCAPDLERRIREFEESLPNTLETVVLRLRRANNPDAVGIDEGTRHHPRLFGRTSQHVRRDAKRRIGFGGGSR